MRLDTIAGVASPVSVRRAAPNPCGNYLAYYAQLRDHLCGLTPEPPVSARDVRAVMQLLTLGEQSAAQGLFLAVPV